MKIKITADSMVLVVKVKQAVVDMIAKIFLTSA